MTRKTLPLDDKLREYCLTHAVREHPVLSQLRKRTALLPEADAQIAPEQGQLMAWLVKLMNARNILEIGCFTGYSALVMALAMPSDGRMITLDINEYWTSIAREFWQDAGVSQRIELRLGLAAESLSSMIEEGAAGSFDIAFVDADKKNYDIYYEASLKLVRRGGIIIFDNMFWGGSIVNHDDSSRQVASLRALQRKLHEDMRIDIAMVPIADGIMLAYKR